MGTQIRFKRGNKSDMPLSVSSGTPLWCEDTQELYVGTGTSVKKIGIGDLSQADNTDDVLHPLGVRPESINQIQRNSGISMQGGNITADAFIGKLLGNSNTATKLETARSVTLTGGVSGTANFDGSNNLVIETQVNSDYFPLLASMTFERELSPSESFGWLEQGSLVTNVYQDAVNRIVSEYNSGVAKTQLIEENWIQPLLTDNGALGGTTFAVKASSQASNSYQAYMAFRGDDATSFWRSASQASGGWYLIFYNPTPLKVSKLDITINAVANNPTGGIFQGSNDGENWTDLCTFTNTTATHAADKFVVDVRANNSFYKYYRIYFTGSSSKVIDISEVVIWATYLVNSFPYRLASNGDKIALSNYKNIIDDYYNREGHADFYILDMLHSQFYLPRDIGAPATRHIVKSLRYGSEWYDLYNDGWIEQGGVFYQYANTSTSNSYNWIQLHRIMREFDYTANADVTDAQYCGTTCTIWGRKTTGFNMYVSASYKKIMWRVSGWTSKPTLDDYDTEVLNKLRSKRKYYKVGNVIQHLDGIDISSILSDISALQTKVNKLSGAGGGGGNLFKNFYKSNQYDFAAKSFITIEHNLGLSEEEIERAMIVPCLICTTSVAGYSLGQIIELPTILAYASYPIPQPYSLYEDSFVQRTGDNYAFWINRYNRSYGYHYLTTSDVVNCFKYFVKIWY